ncbi:aldehyde dehydrogenase [Lacinutrix sp. C3R15]|uniref:aldehyde dehydrogenase n=1 Tax=Flavobacteriaceae TaxID=49546 RepID=UPI001C08685D|nr:MULTISPECIES: aldehyde dehydrogenase [Flavobacteriaceae]MBU2939831.1 aldehyde dehydrogenase [Lacinutrix sp. C3R15]MDO6623147.1 aldehyde dehydrogenase [Oceanihabitans sp. 1_MG-2023]
MKQFDQFINGKFVKSTSTKVTEVLNPCTEEILSEIPYGSVEDANKALDAAKESQHAWKSLTAVERAGYLHKMANVIRENRVFLAETLAAEQAKVIGLAQVEIDVTADYFDYYAGFARRIEGEIIQSDRKKEHIFLHKAPIGVAVGILPWNFPFFVMARKVAGSLITGNTCVIKPSCIAPNTIMEWVDLIQKIELPAGVLNFVCGSGPVVGNALSKSPITGIISLTGSVFAGQKVMEAASENITKVSLELGGKAPAIVCADANLELAVNAVVGSRIIYSGQVCNCAERVYVEESIHDQFLDMVTAKMNALKVEDAFSDNNPDMSALVSKAQLDKVAEMVEFAKKEGAEVLIGGEKSSQFDKGYFYQPTLLTNVRQDMQIIQDEVFGPVLPVMKFSTLDEAIALANDSEYGLTSSIFSENFNKVMHAAEELQYGETYINREHFEAIQGFHAGWKKSGIGGADGKHGMEEYLQTKVIYAQYR